MFRHVNGRIRVGSFECTTQEFAVIEPDYSGLPEGVIERRYDPLNSAGRPKHVIITADHRQSGGPVPWPEGDILLKRVRDYPGRLNAISLRRKEAKSR